MSEKKQELKLELVDTGKISEANRFGDLYTEGAKAQLQADSKVVEQLQTRIKELERLLAVMGKQYLIDDETEKELSAELESLKAELAKKDEEIANRKKAQDGVYQERQAVYKEISNLKQEHQEQIKEIFQKMESQNLAEVLYSSSGIKALPLTYMSWYQALKSKYLPQPRE
jgi:phenylalanyl-tRNA synthetase alpha subunit